MTMDWESHMPALFGETSFETRVDRLLGEALRSVGAWASAWAPECNVYETGDQFCVQIAIPGVEVNHVDARVENQTLFVKGERRAGTIERGTWHAREMKEGPFACSFHIPSYADHGRSTASYAQGVLTIRFPKREERKPRRIKIEGPRWSSMRPDWWTRGKRSILAWFERAGWPRRRWLRMPWAREKGG